MGRERRGEQHVLGWVDIQEKGMKELRWREREKETMHDRRIS